MKTCSLSQADQKFLAALSPASQVIYRWAFWRKEKGNTPARRIATLRKGDAELLVFEYGPKECCVVKKVPDAGRKPMFKSFRKWSQPFRVIMQKLGESKWELVGMSVKEVGHAH